MDDMPSAKFALEPGGEKRLVVSWSGFWKNIRVLFDDEEIGSFTGKAELGQGKSFTLPDRSVVQIKFNQGFGYAEWQVTRNGVPLPGASGNPAEQVKAAGYILYFIAGLNGLLGLISLVFNSETLQSVGIGGQSLVAALIYGVLGFFTLKRSKVALILGIVLFALDGLVTLALTTGSRGTPPMGGVIMRVFLLIPMIRAVKAMNELKQPDKEEIQRAFD